MSSRDTAVSARGAGSALFAAIMLMVAGTVNVIYGIAAIGESKFFVGETRYVFSNLNTWGWITLLLGIIAIFAGLSVSRGGAFGRISRDLRREHLGDRRAAFGRRGLSVLVARDLRDLHRGHSRPRGV